jgi:hypothetical protein
LELWVELGVLSHASLRKKLGFGSTKAFFLARRLRFGHWLAFDTLAIDPWDMFSTTELRVIVLGIGMIIVGIDIESWHF